MATCCVRQKMTLSVQFGQELRAFFNSSVCLKGADVHFVGWGSAPFKWFCEGSN